MTPERGLWAALVALAVGDAVTTITALSLGLPEANPLIDALVARAGEVDRRSRRGSVVGPIRLVRAKRL